MNRARILIVEDEFIVANDIAARLTDFGYIVAGQAASAQSAIALAGTTEPDLVLMDIRLQGSMDGIAAAGVIRQRYHLPVVFLTAFADDSTLDRAKLVEPFGYILKPFDDRELRTNIEIALYKHKAEAEIRRLTRLYATLSQVNQAIVRVRSREELFSKICQIAIEFGGFKVAWIALLDAANNLVPVAHAGMEQEEMAQMPIRDCHCARGAVETGRPCHINQLATDPKAALCREAAAKLGLRACAAYPIRLKEELRGVLAVGVDETAFFNEAETRLLDEVAMAISFALDRLENERLRVKAEAALQEREQRLRTILQAALDSFWIVDTRGKILEVNDAACLMSGYSRQELLQMRITDLESAETEQETADHIQRIVRLGGDRFESRHHCKDGHVIHVEVMVTYQDFDGGRFVCFLRDITERKKWEQERELTIEFLRLVNASTETRDMVRAATVFFQKHSGFDAVGIRLQEGEDYPYFEARGFPTKFVQMENNLCARDKSGEIIHDSHGDPLIECMCGNVICGRFDPSMPFFTHHGSFWTNSTTELLASTTDAQRQARTRNRCNGEGYESMALIPLRAGAERFGLLQLNDGRKGQLSAEIVALWERLADQLSIALAKFRTKEQLRNSEARYRSLFQNMREGLAHCKMIFDDQGRPVDFVYLDVNEAFGVLTGLRNVVGKKVTEIIPNIEAQPELLERYGRVATTGVPEKFEIDLKALGIWFSISAYSSNQGYFVAVFHNITERKRAEEDLQRLTRLLNQAQAVAKVGGWELNLKHERVFWTEATYRIHDLSPHEFIPQTQPIPFVAPEWEPAISRATRKAIEEGEDIDEQIGIITAKHRRLWVHVAGHPIVEDGQTVKIVGSIQDITEQKQIRQALDRQLSLMQALTSTAPDSLFMLDAGGRVTFANPAAEKMFGFENSELMGAVLHKLVHDKCSDNNSRPESDCPIRQVCSGGQTIRDHEDLFYRRDGSPIYVSCSSAPLGGDSAFASVLVIRDISERKRAELELNESTQRLRTAVDASRLGIWSRDLRTGELIWDHRMREIYGLGEQEAITLDRLLSLVVPEDHEIFKEAFVRLSHPVAGGTSDAAATWEYRIIGVDGIHWIRVMGNTVRDDHGRIIRLTGFAIDVTEQKQAEQRMHLLEEQLQVAQKMEAIGRLAGGVAHDFNNLLMVIRSYTEIIQDHLPVNDGLRNHAQQVLKASDRAASLTGQLLAFSRKQMVAPIVLDLNDIVSDTAKMLKRVIGEDIELRICPAASLWSTRTDPDQVVQVLMNLCVNARDAMPQGGMITITTANIPEDQTEEYVYLGRQDYVMLSVADNGEGMTQEVQEHIFEPFYTTKPLGKGTGLGLSTVYGIVEQSGGRVWATSEPGEGTCFTMCLPRAQEPKTSAHTTKTGDVITGTETLMVVEDETALRESIGEFLRDLGYTVLTAASGQEALILASQSQDFIDALIVDVVMPKMSGRELSQQLTSMRPNLKTIYMSGYTDDLVMRHGISETKVAFLQKPFSLGTLARKLRDVIDSTKLH